MLNKLNEFVKEASTDILHGLNNRREGDGPSTAFIVFQAMVSSAPIAHHVSHHKNPSAQGKVRGSIKCCLVTLRTA